MSHHGNPPDNVNKALKEEMKKLFGEYPQGKLNDDDQGALAMAIYESKGTVVMHFPKSITWVAFTGDQAMEIAQMLMENARKAGITKPFVLKV